MREIIYYSRTAPTAGNYIKEDLYDSGRLDIAVHSLVAAFFLSHKIRTDVKFHLVFAGPPNPQRHLEFVPVIEGKTGIDKIYINKRNVADVIKKMLYKCKPGEKREVFPGFWIEERGFLDIVKDLSKQGRNLYLLDSDGEDVRTIEIASDPVFIMGDHKGLPSKEFKRLKTMCTPVSIGKRTYFASQTVAVLNNELDRREDEGRL